MQEQLFKILFITFFVFKKCFGAMSENKEQTCPVLGICKATVEKGQRKDNPLNPAESVSDSNQQRKNRPSSQMFLL